MTVRACVCIWKRILWYDFGRRCQKMSFVLPRPLITAHDNRAIELVGNRDSSMDTPEWIKLIHFSKIIFSKVVPDCSDLVPYCFKMILSYFKLFASKMKKETHFLACQKMCFLHFLKSFLKNQIFIIVINRSSCSKHCSKTKNSVNRNRIPAHKKTFP